MERLPAESSYARRRIPNFQIFAIYRFPGLEKKEFQFEFCLFSFYWESEVGSAGKKEGQVGVLIDVGKSLN